MTKLQKDFAHALIALGLSEKTILVVCVMIQTQEDILEFLNRVIAAEDSGKNKTDGLVGQILVDMMKEATQTTAEGDTP